VEEKTKLLPTALILISTVVLSFKLATPAYVQVIIEANTTIIREIPNLYTRQDVAIILVFSFTLGYTIAYLLYHTRTQQLKTSTPEIIKSLGEDEIKVYTIIKNEGIIYQHEIVKMTGFSKAKVSRILDKLEATGLIERKRRGTSNIVVLRK